MRGEMDAAGELLSLLEHQDHLLHPRRPHYQLRPRHYRAP